MFDPFQRNETEFDVVIAAFDAHKGDDDKGVGGAKKARNLWARRAENNLDNASRSMRRLIALLWEANGGCLYGSMSSYDIDGPNPRSTFGHGICKFAYATPEESWKELWKYFDRLSDGETAWYGLTGCPDEGHVFDVAIDEWTAV